MTYARLTTDDSSLFWLGRALFEMMIPKSDGHINGFIRFSSITHSSDRSGQTAVAREI
jgi:hypothetical protein